MGVVSAVLAVSATAVSADNDGSSVRRTTRHLDPRLNREELGVGEFAVSLAEFRDHAFETTNGLAEGTTTAECGSDGICTAGGIRLSSAPAAHKISSANAAPAFSSSATFDAAENQTAAGTVSAADSDAGDDIKGYAISGGADQALFSIGATSGTLTFDAAPNYEDAQDQGANNTYVVEVQATSGIGERVKTATQTITVTVTNLDEEGTVSLFPAQLRVRTVVRATLTDPDGDLSAVSWRWAESSDKTIWTNISGAIQADYLPTEARRDKYLRAEASYGDGEGSNKTSLMESNAVVGEREPGPVLSVKTLVTGLRYPWGIAFTPDGTMLFTERDGHRQQDPLPDPLQGLSSLRTDGTLRTVSADFSDLDTDENGGVMGLEVDPDFVDNRRIYICQQHTGSVIQVVAWTIDATYTTATRANDPLVGNIPREENHNGCRLRFGPDGNLWISTGDTEAIGTVPQDLNSLGGKILRVDPLTGAAPADNPFSGSLVYSYGHRNPQGLALRPGTRQMWAVEHGPTVDDEINLLRAGANYGWDPVPTDEDGDPTSGYDDTAPMTDLVKFPGAVEAKWSSGNPTLATSGGIFLEGEQWGLWEGRLAVATLKGRSLRIFEFTEDGTFVSHVVPEELDHFSDRDHRLRTPMIGPDNALYLSTSTRGWRDEILRVTPEQAPEFPNDIETRQVIENTGGDMVVATVEAADYNHDELTYTLGDTDGELFYILDENVGELRVKSTTQLDYETRQAYVVTVTATDPQGLSDSTTLTISVTDMDEAPGKPGVPAVSAVSVTSLSVGWSAPDNAGPAITDYDVRYRAGISGAWSDAGHAGTAVTATLAGLSENTSYQVQVRAANAEGTGAWSDAGSGRTDANAAPVFSSSATFDMAENGTEVAMVMAADSDSEDKIERYDITGGADQSFFLVIASSGHLEFKTAPNYEDPRDQGANNTYVVEVQATSGAGERAKTATQTITVTVTDVSGEAPAKPGAPAVSAVSVSSLSVGWSAPANAGPAITDYDVRYRAGNSGAWSDGGHAGTAVTATLTGLSENTSYEVQVRAANDEGTGSWSDAGSGRTDANAAPVFSSSATFDMAENGTEVAMVMAADSDSEDKIERYDITGGADQSFFLVIASSGHLEFKTAPNYEDPRDQGANNTYVVEVTATSGTGTREKTATQTITVTVTVAGPPDLVVDEPTVSASNPAAGSSFTLSARVRNSGGSAAVSITLVYYRSSDATISTSDASVGTDAVGALGAGASSAESIPLTAPASAATYYYGACVDAVTDESDTTNNCSVAVAVTVIAPRSGVCGRTEQVRDAIVAATLGVSDCADVTTTQLSGVTVLSLNNRGIKSLQPGDFSGLTALEELDLSDNELGSLPDGVFSGLTALGLLGLGGNAEDPLPLAVSLEMNRDAVEIRAVVAAAAPFAVPLAVSVENGGLAGGAATITVPAGARESAWVGVTRTSGTTAAVTADIDLSTQPSLPDDHSGYAFVKSASGLPLTVLRAVDPTDPGPRRGGGGGGGGGGGPAAVVEIGGVSYAAAGAEAVFTAAVSDGTRISASRWTVTGPGAFTATSNAPRLVFVAPAGGTYTVRVTVDDAAGQTLTGRVTLTVFGDIGGHRFVDEILRLAEEGITQGCDAHSYCPGNPVTRAQMASFLARALDLTSPRERAGFADVDPTSVHAANIEALHAAEITSGCGQEPLQYCPSNPVTRAQMASFLARALDLEAPPRPAGFVDVDPSGVHAANIEALFAAQVTTGCTQEPLQYCPNRHITRAQMAAFLHRARDLIV